MTTRSEFAARSVVVTGAARGIGFSVAQLFASCGANLVIVGRNEEALEHAAGRLAEASGGAVCAVAGDVSHPETARKARDVALERYGAIDCLANIAGEFPTARLEDTTDEQFARTMASNLTGTFLMCRTIGPLMRARGQGAIVNMSSVAARFPTPGLSVYSASKGAVESFTRAIAAELAPRVRVNAVSAGPTLTEKVRMLMDSDTSGAVSAVTSGLPLGRLGTPEEVANAVLFLASDRASYMTGQILQVNGGGLMA